MTKSEINRVFASTSLSLCSLPLTMFSVVVFGETVIRRHEIQDFVFRIGSTQQQHDICIATQIQAINVCLSSRGLTLRLFVSYLSIISLTTNRQYIIETIITDNLFFPFSQSAVAQHWDQQWILKVQCLRNA